MASRRAKQQEEEQEIKRQKEAQKQKQIEEKNEKRKSQLQALKVRNVSLIGRSHSLLGYIKTLVF